MMDAHKHTTLTIIAKGATATLREVVDQCDDPAFDRWLHSELLWIAGRIASRRGYNKKKLSKTAISSRMIADNAD